MASRQWLAKLEDWSSHLSLRRIITSSRFIPEVDGFRFLAILIVILSHFYLQCGPIPLDGPISRGLRAAVYDGPRGVYLFFAISGFILALPFARTHLQGGAPVNVGRYFQRRITRLEPPYVLAMLLRVPAILVIKRGAASAVLLHLLASLLYVHNLVYGSGSTINPPAWSLEVEIQFYVLAPLLASVFMIKGKSIRRAVLIAIILASGTCATLFIDPSSRFAYSLANFAQYFFAGFLLCDLYLCGDRIIQWRWLWDVIGVASLIWILASHSDWYQIELPFAVIALYMAGFYGAAWRSFFAFRPISLIGGMCYSIYLTHSTVLAAAAPLVHRILHSSLPWALQIPLIYGMPMAAVLAVGTIYFLLIERPCMDPAWPQKLAQWFRRR
jgi:peptidoglycan/LPS O-acetylase OafA/YrhL